MKELLEKYIDTICEVKTMANDLLLIARLKRVSDDFTLSVDLVSSDGGNLANAPRGLPVKLNLRSANDFLVVGGRIFITNEVFWRISDVSQYQNFERRSFFRVSTNASGLVYELNDEVEPTEIPSYPAHLLDISLAGVRFSCEHFFEEGKQLCLSAFTLADDKIPFFLNCSIKKREDSLALPCIYRCQFENVSQKDSDRLCKAIFALQSESIKKQRNRI